MSKIKISDLNFPPFNRVTDEDLLVIVDAETNETKKASKKQLLDGMATLGNITEVIDSDYISTRIDVPPSKVEAVVDSQYIHSRLNQGTLNNATREFVDSNYVNALIRNETITDVIDSDYVSLYSALQTQDVVDLVDSDYVNARVLIESGKKIFTAAESISAGDVVKLNNQGTIEKPVITQVHSDFSDTLTRTGSDGINLKVAFMNDTQGSLLFLYKENEDYKIIAGKVTPQGAIELGTSSVTLSTGEYSYDWDIAADTSKGNHFVAVGDNGDGEGVVVKSGTVDANLNIFISDTFVENGLSSRYNRVAYDESTENYLWIGTDVFGATIINVNPNTRDITFGARADLSSVLPNSISYSPEHDLIYAPNRNKFIAAFSSTGANAEVFAVSLTLSEGSITVSDKTVIESRPNGDYKDVRLFSAPSSTFLQYSYRADNVVFTSFLELLPDNSSYEMSAGTIQTLSSSVKNPTWQYDRANSVFFFYAMTNNKAVYSIYTKKNGLLTKAAPDVELVTIPGSTAEYLDKGSEGVFVPTTNSVVFHIQTTSGPYAFVLKNSIDATENVRSIIGIAAEDIPQGSSGYVTVSGGINYENTQLIAGSTYNIDGMGTITTDATSFGTIGRALSSNEILVGFESQSESSVDSDAIMTLINQASFDASGFSLVTENLVNKVRADRRIQVPHGIQSGVQFGLDDFDGGTGDVLHIYAETLRTYQDSAPAESTRLYLRSRNDTDDKVAIWTQDDFGLVHTTDGLLENVIWHEGNLDPNRQSQDLDLAGHKVSDIGGQNFLDLDNDETTDGTTNNVVINSVQGIYNIIDANTANAPTGNSFGVWHGKSVDELADDNALFRIDENGDTLVSGSLEAKEIINGKFIVSFGGAGIYTLSDQYNNWFASPTNNPPLYLRRGETYLFNIQTTGHPFEIRVENQGIAYNNGVTNNGAETGVVKFKVPMDAPNELYYQCTLHSSMGNKIHILRETRLSDIEEWVDSDYVQSRVNFDITLDSAELLSMVDSDYIQARVDFTGYATEQWVEDKGYITDYAVSQGDVTQHEDALSITESQISDLKDYLTSADLSDYATEQWVVDQGYATETWVGQRGYITDYTVTEGDVTQHQSALSITESQISDLQNYLTSADLSSYATQQWVGEQGYITDYTVTQGDVTQHQSALSITENQISDLQDYLTSADLSSYATETWVGQRGYLTSTDLDEYATETWVSQNYLSAGALVGYATESWVLEQDFGGDNLSHDNGNFIDLDVDEVFFNAMGSVNDVAISSAQGIYNIIDNNNSTESNFNTSNNQYFGVWSGKSTGSGDVADLRTTNAVFLVDEDGNTTVKGSLTVNGEEVGGALVDGEFNVGYGTSSTSNQDLITGIAAARREIFDNWYRFSHDTSGNYPANTTELNSFQFDETNLNIYSPTNTSTVVGFVSPVTYKDYDFSTMLDAQGNNDDDGIGVLLAWAVDAQGKEHTVTLWRAMGYGGGVGFSGGASSYFIVYNAGQSDAQLIFDGDTLAPHVNDATNWENYSTFVSVTKRGKSFSVACSQFKTGTSTINDIDESTRHTFNLNDFSFGSVFSEKTNYGYVAQSQPLATWTGTEFYGEGIRLYTDLSQFYTFEDGDNVWFPTVEANPILYLRRGDTYKFNISSTGHPFQLKYSFGGDLYNTGVTNNGADDGEIIFKVPMNAPATLYYRCSLHGAMGNAIFIV